MTRQFLSSIGRLVNDKPTWEAFVSIMEYEQNKTLRGLIGKPTTEDLIRTQANYDLLERMRNNRYRENLIKAAEEFKNAPSN